MHLNKIEVLLLNSLADDYENISSILPDISRELKRPITENEIVSCLRQLLTKRLIDAYRFDSQRYEKVGSVDTFNNMWFMINARGLATLVQAKNEKSDPPDGTRNEL